jgi:UDP-N-acetylmuramyl pentapeptide phosphotransferase/UDP-N-acetylglucosamine-1-phosphate transferase
MATRIAHASLEGMTQLQSVLWAALLVAGCAGFCALLIAMLKPWLTRYFPAHPNERSSHKTLTPQAAGLAVMATVFAGAAFATNVWAPQLAPSLLPVLGIAAWLTLLGALDDAHTLSVSWRLLGQFLAGVVLVFTLPPSFQIFPGTIPLVVERALLLLGTVWFINAVNFLDGLDWMTVVQVVPVTFGIAIIAALGAVPAAVGVLALTLLGAMLGFAVFNKHPAQIFLGDAGSLPIGLCLAYMLIFVAQSHLAAALLLSLYTLADSTLTLLRRMLAKEPILSAHRTHFYQRGAIAGLSAPQVTARVLILQILLLLLAIATVLAGSLPVDLLCLGLGLGATGLVLSALAKGR